MNPYMVLPVPSRGLRKTVKSALPYFDDPFATLVQRDTQQWLVVTQGEGLDIPNWILNVLPFESVVCVLNYQQITLVMAWRPSQLDVLYAGPTEQCFQVIKSLQAESHEAPRVFTGGYIEERIMVALTGWVGAVPERLPDLNQGPDTPMPLKPLRRIQSKSQRGYAALVLTCALFVSGTLIWPSSAPEIGSEPEKDGWLQMLQEQPANAIPILRFDYNMQLVMQELEGWQIRQVEYTPQGLRYQLSRDGGQIRELRELAQQHDFLVTGSGRELWLSRSFVAPALYSDGLPNAFSPVATLTDWLDDNVRLWLPGSELTRQSPHIVDSWQEQRVSILLNHHFAPDLLTLSGLLDGLPVRLVQAAFRVDQQRVSGQLILDAIGVMP
ncbi:MAG: hypothetical protein JJU10_01800 [Idiomarina sp.]|nr:hypothetical protein [Idiomarina sp.]